MSLLRSLAFALAALLVYVLYLPAADPPEHFLQLMRTEHALNTAFWGEDDAYRILRRALRLYARHDDLAPTAFVSAPSDASGGGSTVPAEQMSALVQRLLHNRYGQGFDALVLLAGYRCAVLAQWLPWVVGFILIACFDACIVRIIRSKEFLAPSPTRFALCATGASFALVLGLLFLVCPTSIHPLLLGSAPLLTGAFAARAIRYMHR
jgi:hypothetical protein